MKKKTRRSFGDELKVQIIEAIAAGKLRPADAIKEHGLYSSMLTRWRNDYEAGKFGPKAPSSADPVPAPLKPKNNGSLVPATPAKAQTVQVLPKKRGRPSKALPEITGPEAATHREIVFYLTRSAERLVAGIEAKRYGVRELTQGYTVDMLTALNAAQGGT